MCLKSSIFKKFLTFWGINLSTHQPVSLNRKVCEKPCTSWKWSKPFTNPNPLKLAYEMNREMKKQSKYLWHQNIKGLYHCCLINEENKHILHILINKSNNSFNCWLIWWWSSHQSRLSEAASKSGSSLRGNLKLPFWALQAGIYWPSWFDDFNRNRYAEVRQNIQINRLFI